MSNEKKYEIIKDDYIVIQEGNVSHKLYRIRALRDIPTANVVAGDFGGRIAGEYNLSQHGNCWVGPFATVYENARVMDNAQVVGYDTICGCATIGDEAYVNANSEIYGCAVVCGQSQVVDCCDVKIFGDALIVGQAVIGTDGQIFDHANIEGHARVSGFATVCGNANIGGNAIIGGHARIDGNAKIMGGSKVIDSHVGGHVDIVRLDVPYRKEGYTSNEEILNEIKKAC